MKSLWILGIICWWGEALSAQEAPPPLPENLARRLQAQANAVSLFESQKSPEKRANWVLSLARLGDPKAAQKLAQNSVLARDVLAHYEGEKWAEKGHWSAALQSAKRIKTPELRADVPLLVARRALDAGAPQKAVGALQIFSNLMDTRATQLAYGGFLWVRCGRDDPALRVWQRALGARQVEIMSGKGVDLYRAQGEKPTLALAREESLRQITSYISHTKKFSLLLRFLEAQDFEWRTQKSVSLWPLLSDQTARRELRAWLEKETGLQKTVPAGWFGFLAFVEAAYGDEAQARRDFEKEPLNAGDERQAVQAQWLFANILNDQAGRETAEKKLAALAPEQPISPMARIFSRLFVWFDEGINSRLSNEEVRELIAQIVAQKPSTNSPKQSFADGFFLEQIVRGCEQRGLKTEARQLAHWAAQAMRAQSVQTFLTGSGSSNGEYRFLQILARLGEKAKAQNLATQFVRETPAKFRQRAALAALMSGFPKAFDAVVDPAQQLSERNRRGGAAFSAEFGLWETVARSQAQYVAPDAPAQWFGKLPTDEKPDVLLGWLEAFFTRRQDKTPTVRFWWDRWGLREFSSY